MWLWCWIGVLVAGCSQNSVTNSPTSTLVLLGLTPVRTTPTPTPGLLRTPRSTSMLIVTLAPASLLTPSCYETPVGGLWCLGAVRNKLLAPLEDVVVRVFLVTRDGVPLAQRDIPIARSSVPPGELSPYGAFFDSVPPDSVGPVAVIIRATQSHADGEVRLEVRHLQSETLEFRQRISGVLVNHDRHPVSSIALVVTLFDVNERVTGFRQLRLKPDPPLLPDAELPFALDVIPQGAGTVRFEASAEAR